MRHCRWGPAIAYYAVIDRSSTRVRLVTSVLLLCGIINCQILPGHTEPYDFFVAALVFVGAAMAAVLSRRTRRAHLAEIEACAGQAESERNREASLAAARERARIARELHDVVAHHVSLMAVHREAGTSRLPSQAGGGWRAAPGNGPVPVAGRPGRRPRKGPERWPAGRSARRRQPQRVGTRCRPHGLPDRAGGPDQHDPPCAGGDGNRDLYV